MVIRSAIVKSVIVKLESKLNVILCPTVAFKFCFLHKSIKSLRRRKHIFEVY